MSGRQSELTDCKPTTMTGTTACGITGSWFWGCGEIGVDEGEGEAAVSDDDDAGPVVADEAGDAASVDSDPKPSEATVDDAMDEVEGPSGVVVVAPGTKACRKLAISMRGGMTGGKRYNLHQLILPDASILPAPRVGDRGELFKPGLEACLAEWKSKKN
jgi:hypothetical protein